MDEDKKHRTVTMILLALFIGIPLIVTVIEPAIGGVLLFVGTIAALRAMRLLVLHKSDEEVQPDRTNMAGQTIFVQMVDDFGRDLLPREVERRLAEARAQAGPRDTVVPVKFKIEQGQNNLRK